MKDRLPELQKVVVAKSRRKSSSNSVEADLINNDDEIMKTLREIEKIRIWINEVTEGTNHMKLLYANTTYGTSKSMQSKMESHMTNCSALGLKISGALKEFETLLNQLNTDEIIWRIASIQYVTTKQLFFDAFSDHNTFLTKYKRSRMAILQQQMKITNQSMTEEECENLLESNKISIFVDNYESETREMRLQLQDIEVRHKELIKIENALKDVRDVFSQIAFLVQQQQDHIDTIEYFVTRATQRVNTGNEQLERGADNKNKSRKKKFYIIICLLVVLIIILAMLIVL